MNSVPVSRVVVGGFQRCNYGHFRLIIGRGGGVVGTCFGRVRGSCAIACTSRDRPLNANNNLGLLTNHLGDTFVLAGYSVLVGRSFSSVCRFRRARNGLIAVVYSLQGFHVPCNMIAVNRSKDVTRVARGPSLSFFAGANYCITRPRILSCVNRKRGVKFPSIVRHVGRTNNGIKICPVNRGT